MANNNYSKESIMFGSNQHLPNNLRGENNITDELLNGAGIYSKQDIEHAKFNNFSRFGRILDPYGRLNPCREYLFFVKPDLHICIPSGKTRDDDIYKISGFNKSEEYSYETEKNGLRLNPQLTNNSYFRDLIDKRPNVVRELQYSASSYNDPFCRLLSFGVNSYLDMASVSAQTMDNPATIYGTSYNYLRDFEASDENNSFGLEFIDDKNLNIYHFFKAYTEYHNARKSGLITPPDLNYYRYKRLHNTMGIYKFIVAEDSETLIYWAYFWGVYPTNCPREAFNSPEFSDGLTFSISFEAAFIEDMNPMLLYQFNNLMKPVMSRYGCNKDKWLPVINQEVVPYKAYDGTTMSRKIEMNNGTLPVAALIDGRVIGNEMPKYRLRWYAPSN